MNAKNVSRGLLATLAIVALAFGITGCQGVKASSSNNNQPVPPTISSFTASSSSIGPCGSVTLSWATSNATSVTISGVSGTLAASASTTVTPAATTTYTLTATGSGGQTATMSVTVTLNPTGLGVCLSATPNPVRAGSPVTLNWTATNTTTGSTITFTPAIPVVEDVSFLLPVGSASFLAPPNPASPLQPTTATYTATVTGAGGATGSGFVVVNVLPPLPQVTFNATPTNILPGQSATLSWAVQNATSFSIDNGVGSQTVSSSGSTTGSMAVTPATTTTYTATATGGDGTLVTVQATVTVNSITLTANPQSVSPNGTTTLTWTAVPQATSVTIDNGVGAVNPPTGGSITTPALSATTTFIATEIDPSGTHSSAPVTVTVSSAAGLQNSIKHIIFLVQENRSFDNYFSQLGAYKLASPNCGSTGCKDDVNLDYNPNVVLPGRAGIPRSPFHERTVRTHNLTPSWNESHADIQTKTTANGTQCTPLPNSNCKMNDFLMQTGSIPEGTSTDPNGDRAMGYYDHTDLPYYYELAAQFATSDTWFSPLLANTVANREYLFSGTSQGDIFPPATNVTCTPTTNPCQFTWPTIFDAMDKTMDPVTGKHVSWRYYYMDSSVFLSQWKTWQNPADQGAVYCIDDWFNVLQSPTADRDLPSVIFIERGGAGVLSPGCANTATAVDEHPDNNIQNGAAETQKIINALMNSSAWKDSIFILTYDEGGGVYDHVPPFNEPPPDAIAPKLKRSNDRKGQFNQSGFRVPLIVLSPFAKPHFVSHVNRDNTAILKLIETRFGIPALTARDSFQDDMTEFFDFSNPVSGPSLKAPGGVDWMQYFQLHPEFNQPTNGTDDMRLETHP